MTVQVSPRPVGHTSRRRAMSPLDVSAVADWAVGIALIVVLIAGWLLSDVFFSSRNLEAILVASSILVVVTIGQAFVVMTAGIDLSAGSLVQLSSVLVGYAVARSWGLPIALVMAVVGGLLLGTANGLIIAKGKISDFIVTLGMLSIASGIALVASNARPVTVNSSFMTELASGSLGPIHNMIVVAALIAVLAHVLLFHTRFGTHLLAVGGNSEGSRDMGINVTWVKVRTYALAGATAGVGGIMLTARIGAAEPSAGSTFLLNSVAAVVLGGVSLFGGRGSIAGPVAGAILLSALLNLMNILGVGVFYQPIVVGSAVILSALMYRFRRT